MNTKPTGGSDPLEKMFLLAGRREPVDPTRAERVQRNARAHWQRMLARRRAEQRRRRVSWIGGGAAMAASIVAAVMLVPRPGTPLPVVATVVKLLGAPQTGARGHAMRSLAAGAELRAGSVLETSGDEGVALRLASGHGMRLAEATRVRIEADAVVLDAGAVYVDSGGDGRARPIELRSRIATISELGTQYMVLLAGSALEVSVREGAVRVARENMADTARAGEMLRLNASGQTRKAAIAAYGERWAWVTRLASTPDLEGMTLDQFLEWLAREQGWQLEFASADDGTAAAGVELYGSIEGLSGEESLAAVMGSTGWHHRLEEGALIVRARPERRP